MSCAFDLEHYRELLEAAKAGGYRFAHFGDGPEPGDLFLRHDVDLSLEAALEMAEVESELGVTTTYLLMTESIFYNLASPDGTAAIARLRELGHAVGLHAVYPNVQIDERFDAVVSWHNPRPEFMSAEIPGAVNAYGHALLLPGRVSLRLESALALGLSARRASRGCLPLAPDPRAPRDLGVPGRDDGRDDASHGRGRESASPRAARRRRNRPCLTRRGRFASSTARSTPPAFRGRTSRRCAGEASTRSSSCSTATSSIPKPTSRSSATEASPADRRRNGARSCASCPAPTSSTSTSDSRSSRARSSSRSCGHFARSR